MDKRKLAADFRYRRNSLTDKKRTDCSKAACHNLFGSEIWEKTGTLFCFLSFGSEIETDAIIKKALEEKRTVAVPRITNEKKMEAAVLSSPENMQTGMMGIREPDASAPVLSGKEISLVIVPGLVFDRRGYRIGYGGGYYDRFLAETPSAVKAAVGFDFQLADFHIPEAEYDIPVDFLVTEKKIYSFVSSQGGRF